MDKDKAIGRWISIIFRNAAIMLARQLAPLGVARGQYLYLAELYHNGPEPLGQDVLSERLLIDKGTTARALAQLEHSGLVRRRRNPADHRAKTVYLTPAAHKLNERFFNVLWGVSEAMVQGFTPEEREQLLGLLRRMAANAKTARLGETASQGNVQP